jgi:hypothetical protein
MSTDYKYRQQPKGRRQVLGSRRAASVEGSSCRKDAYRSTDYWSQPHFCGCKDKVISGKDKARRVASYGSGSGYELVPVVVGVGVVD